MTVSNFSDVIMLASVHSQYVLASGKCVQYRSLQANALLIRSNSLSTTRGRCSRRKFLNIVHARLRATHIFR